MDLGRSSEEVEEERWITAGVLGAPANETKAPGNGGG